MISIGWKRKIKSKRKREEKAVRVKKRKLDEAAKLVAQEACKEIVKQVTPILIAAKKTLEGKASSFSQIQDFLRKKHGISKS